EKAGLKKYDLIVAVDGKNVKTNTDLSIKIADASPGDIVELTIYRENQKQTIKVKVGEAPDTVKYITPGEESRSLDLGMVLVENSPRLARQYDLKTSKGILVKQVERGGSAYRNDIRELDVILEANGKILESLDQFRRIISKKKPGSSVLLYINREGQEGMIKFKLPE
ncbi:MAG: PDZ domain-containing protein, partial [Candidatus Aminicenantes bacterium]